MKSTNQRYNRSTLLDKLREELGKLTNGKRAKPFFGYLENYRNYRYPNCPSYNEIALLNQLEGTDLFTYYFQHRYWQYPVPEEETIKFCILEGNSPNEIIKKTFPRGCSFDEYSHNPNGLWIDLRDPYEEKTTFGNPEKRKIKHFTGTLDGKWPTLDPKYAPDTLLYLAKEPNRQDTAYGAFVNHRASFCDLPIAEEDFQGEMEKMEDLIKIAEFKTKYQPLFIEKSSSTKD